MNSVAKLKFVAKIILNFSLAVFDKTSIITLAMHEIGNCRRVPPQVANCRKLVQDHLVRGTTAAGAPPNRAAGKQHQNDGYLECRVGL